MYPYNPYSYMSPQMSQQNPFTFNQMAPAGSSPFSSPQEAQITVAQVQTVDQVERVQMLPGERKIVLVQNDPNFLAIRVADNAGFVSTEYRTSTVIDPKKMNQQPQYAPIQVVAELKNEVDEIKKALGGVINANAEPASQSAAGAK